ncbi:hypothetical protein EC991_001615 [Linnemannia zychae]|nr:hypothetical protein EC991_001615 [Linnemannia zychae]
MPPKKRPAGSTSDTQEQPANVTTSTGSNSTPKTQRPSKKPRDSPGEKPVIVGSLTIEADAAQRHEQHNGEANADDHATANHRALSEVHRPHQTEDSAANNDSSQQIFIHSATNSNAPTLTTSPTPSFKKPFKPRGPRGPYKPRQPKLNTGGIVPSRAATNTSILKPSTDLAFKDTRPWHDYFINRIPSFNESSLAWEFCPPPPREDVLAPEELDKMIADDYARMKPLRSDDKDGNNLPVSHHDGVDNGVVRAQDETTEARTHIDKTKKSQEETHERSQDVDSDSQWDDSGSDSDNNEDASNHVSRSFTPGASTEGTGNGERRRRASKHRPRIKYRFPTPIPPLEYPYLQSSFPYEDYKPPKQHLSTQPDYGNHSQPLPDLWHRPQGSFAMEDLFSQDKLDYSIRMLRKQPIESNKLRLDLYYRRGFQLAAKQLLDRARVAYYRKHDHANKHTLQVPNLFNEIDEARLRSSKRSHKDINILRSLGIEGKIVHRERSLLSTSPTIVDATTSTLSIPVAATETSGTSTSGNSISSATPTNHAGFSSSQVPQNHSQTASDSANQTEAIAKDRMAYYEVNQFLATMFNHRNIGGKVAYLSPKACMILRTLMGGLEKKIVSMGCKLQREELTRRLAEIDTFLSNRTREMNRARKERQKSERDGYHSGEVASLASLLPARSLSPLPVATSTSTSTLPSKESMGAHAMTAYEKPFYPLLDVDPVEYYIRTATSRNPHDPRLTMVTVTSAPREFNQVQEDMEVAGPSKNIDGSEGQYEPPAITMSTSTTKMTVAGSGLPFVTNPLRIPGEMEPFWRVRKYVERMSAAPAAPSSAMSHITEIERLRQAQRDISASEPSPSSSPLLGAIDKSQTVTEISDAVLPRSTSTTLTPIRTIISSKTADIT